MKKKVAFEKKIKFPTMIGEITEISLEKDLKFANNFNIEGNLLLTGKYKLTEASRIEEKFNYDIPIEITLTEKLDFNTANIEISDFYYEIENDDNLVCNVELFIEGEELVETLEFDDLEKIDRECDGDKIIEKEVEVPVIDTNDENEQIEEVEDSLFGNLDDDSDTYGTFIVYMVRQNESINSIIEKYHTTVEELQKYNDINNIEIGTKLIIPYVNE